MTQQITNQLLPGRHNEQSMQERQQILRSFDDEEIVAEAEGRGYVAVSEFLYEPDLIRVHTELLAAEMRRRGYAVRHNFTTSELLDVLESEGYPKWLTGVLRNYIQCPWNLTQPEQIVSEAGKIAAI